MKRIALAAALALSSLVPSVAVACDGHSTQASITTLTVPQVASLTKEKKTTPVDANGEKTRLAEGVVPGAVLLTSSSAFAAEELPRDKAAPLVFYCANERCSASHGAAARARELGFTNVAVMPEGIKGWKAAGQPTAKPNS